MNDILVLSPEDAAIILRAFAGDITGLRDSKGVPA